MNSTLKTILINLVNVIPYPIAFLYFALLHSFQGLLTMILMFIDAALYINKWFFFQQKPQLQHKLLQQQNFQQVNYLKTKILWIIYAAFQGILLLGKIVVIILIASSFDLAIGQNVSLAFQVPTQLTPIQIIKSLLPSIILFLISLGKVFIPSEKYTQKYFLQKINNNIITVLYLVLTLNIIFIECLNYGVMGICCVALLIGLLILKWKFKNKMVILINCFLTMCALVGGYIIQISFLQIEEYQILQTLGVKSFYLNKWQVNIFYQNYAYLIILYQNLLSSLLLLKYFNKQTLHLQIISHRQRIIEQKDAQKKKCLQRQQQNQLLQQIGQQIEDQEEDILQIKPRRVSSFKEVSLSYQQVQMSHRLRSSQNQESLQPEQQKESPLKQQKEKQLKIQVQKQSKVKQMFKVILNKLNSLTLILRLFQLSSIVLIQRINTLQNLLLLFGLMVSIFIFKTSRMIPFLKYFMLPVSVIQFFILFYSNLQNVQIPVDCYIQCRRVGFIDYSQAFWQQILIFNVYFCLLMFYIKIGSQRVRRAEKLKRRRGKRQKSKVKQISYGTIVLAIIFKYTYFISLGIVYAVGFSDATVLNLIQVLIFLVFFSTGQRLITYKKEDKIYLTNFAHRYWIVIVIFTALCIIAKYFYFMFWQPKQFQQVTFIGIDQTNTISINFSLTSKAYSYTTPLFLQLILTSLQYFITNSSIYLKYSSNILRTLKQKPFFNKYWHNIYPAILVLNALYYQLIFAISVIIIMIMVLIRDWGMGDSILLCMTVIIAIIAALQGWVKAGKIWKYIVYVNLISILLTFLSQFFFEYNFIKQNVPQFLFTMLSSLGIVQYEHILIQFLNNIVIFFFSGLSNNFHQMIVQAINLQKSDNQKVLQIKQTHKSISFEKEGSLNSSNIQLDVNMNQYDENFFKLHKQENAVIINEYYNYSLIPPKTIPYNIVLFFSLLMTDISTIMVIVACIYFRLCILMFMFLSIYMYYFWATFADINSKLHATGYFAYMPDTIVGFWEKLERYDLYERLINRGYEKDAYQFLKHHQKQIIMTRISYKGKIFKFVVFLAAISLLITYNSEYLLLKFSIQNIPQEIILDIQWVLFLLGLSTSSQQSLFYQIYFYILIFFLCILQRLCSHFLQKDYHISINAKLADHIFSKLKVIEQQKQEEDEEMEIQIVSQDVQIIQHQKIRIQNDFILPPQYNNYPEPKRIRATNLLLYPKAQVFIVQSQISLGFLFFLVRIFSILFLYNAAIKQDAFSWIYLSFSIFFWLRTVDFNMVNQINKCAILCILLQYLLLLFNITSQSSPLKIPQQLEQLRPLSLISGRIPQDYIVYFAFKTSITFLLTAFLIFLTQLFYFVFDLITNQIIKSYQKLLQNYESIFQGFETIQVVSMNKWKSIQNKWIINIFGVLINSLKWLFIVLLITILLIEVDILSLILLPFILIYLYMLMFTNVFSQKLTSFPNFLTFLKYLYFINLLITLIYEIPYFHNQCNDNESFLCKAVNDINLGLNIFIIFCIGIMKDIISSQKVENMYLKYQKKNQFYSTIFNITRQKVKNSQAYLKQSLKFFESQQYHQSGQQLSQQLSQFHNSNKFELSYDQKQYPFYLQIELPLLSHDILFLVNFLIWVDGKLPVINVYLQKQIRNQWNQVEQIIKGINQGQDNQRISNFIHKLIDKKNKNLMFKKLHQPIQQITEQQQRQIQEIAHQRQNPLPEQQSLHDFPYLKIITPELLNFVHKYQKPTLPQKLFFWILEQFQYVVFFFSVLYYLDNPALLSLPVIIIVFIYALPTGRPASSILLIYFAVVAYFSKIVKLFFSGSGDWLKVLINSQNTWYLSFLIFLTVKNQIIYREVKSFKYTQKWSLGLFRSAHLDKYFYWKQKVKKIFQNPQQLEQKKMTYFYQLCLNPNKEGIQLYSIIATIQIITIIYTIIFYGRFGKNQYSDIQESIRFSNFSGDMVLVVLTQVVFIVSERYITTARSKLITKQIMKTIQVSIIFTFIVVFVYYISPLGKSHGAKVNYAVDGYLAIFFLLNCLYFAFSAIQLRYGYEKYRFNFSLLHKCSLKNFYFLTVICLIPFLLQLKLLMDWAFSQTTLALFDWIKHINIYITMYNTKISAMDVKENKVGQTRKWYLKAAMGWCGFILILLLLFGPMILFSNLNPSVKLNPVIGGSLQIGLQINKGNFFPLYSTSHLSKQSKEVNQTVRQQLDFNKVPEIAYANQNQLQEVNFYQYSDNYWELSQPNKKLLVDSINDTINNPNSTNYFRFMSIYDFQRNLTDSISTPNKFYSPPNALNKSQLQDLLKCLTQCNYSFTLNNFYISLVSLNSQGSSFKPRPIIRYSNNQLQYNNGLKITKMCDNQFSYWKIDSIRDDQQINGFEVYVLTDKQSDFTFGFSLITLYTSVILVIGQALRGVFTSQVSMIPYTDIPHPDALLRLCQAIQIFRMQQNYRKEYLLYYQLLDIMRSPEVLKKLGGSYQQFLQQVQLQQKRQKEQ